MRTLLVTFALIFGLAAVPARQHALLGSPATALAAGVDVQQPQAQQPQAPQPTPQVNVQVHRDGWRPNPVWMAIGGIGAVLLILIIVLIARGGGGSTTTVLR
jgi:glucose/arabinose dehydrogenase